ncbi:MAG TPA: hypothetical protein PLZ44_02790 [Methanothrix sp.]|nr:hypothetical protein [Methanothrix sp.]
MKPQLAFISAMLLLSCLALPCTALESQFLTISEKSLSVDLGPGFEISKGVFNASGNGKLSQEFLINNTEAPGAAFLSIMGVYDEIMRKLSADSLCEIFLIGGLEGAKSRGDVQAENWTAVDHLGRNVTVCTMKSKDMALSWAGGSYDIAVWNLEGSTYALMVSMLDRKNTTEVIRTLSIK